MKKEALTDEQATLVYSLPLVSELLPYRFENGTVLENLSVACSSCNTEICAKDIRGQFTPTNRQCSTFSAFGLCFGCKTITPLECRFSDDGTFLSKVESGWKQGRFTSENSIGWSGWLKSFWRGERR